MEFHWFNLMPWPHLPEDFRETNRSVWLDLDSRRYDPVEGRRVHNEYLDQLEFAAKAGTAAGAGTAVLLEARRAGL